MIMMIKLSFILIIPVIKCNNIFVPNDDLYTDISGRQVKILIISVKSLNIIKLVRQFFLNNSGAIGLVIGALSLLALTC